jgi:hypothetical protein
MCADRFPQCSPEFIEEQLLIEKVENRVMLKPMRWVPRIDRKFINETGIAYFANSSSDVKKQNVGVMTVRISENSTTKVFIPAREILPFEEILSPYGKKELVPQ